VRRRRDREFRILSLGESSAFGNGVGDAETYAALLEAHLNRAAGQDRFTVINAGVPAYTSFQSLVYLKERGLALEPQMVLFYHEANDLLPTYLRASDNSVLGMNLSDPERHAHRLRRTHRRLLAWSAIYRFIRYRLALSRIERFQQTVGEEFRPAWPVQLGDAQRSLKFPFRVRLEEQIEILRELVLLSREHAFEFVLIHPSYRDSQPHTCVFTEFSRANRVPLIDVHPLLHPKDGPDLFLDKMHPSRRGHERIADALFGGTAVGKLFILSLRDISRPDIVCTGSLFQTNCATLVVFRGNGRVDVELESGRRTWHLQSNFFLDENPEPG
ncbi:MAG: SGNH/GDSL hydrolase family protein, partial [Gemmatimonadetes bacterium]|nr:SGNH/GDSL hydrolase family protein [Gemmatimonadota bacterium]